MRYAAPIAILIVIALAVAGCTNPAEKTETPVAPVPAVNSIRVDAFVPLTGITAQLGEASYAALMTAATDINEYYASVGSPVRVQLYFHDTHADPALARNLTEEISLSGGNAIVGYITSSELSQMKGYADSHSMFILSSGSTAPSLAIPNDSIFRVVSDDTSQGRVMSAYLSGQGIRAMVPVWRGDLWGDGLENATASSFSAAGGHSLEGIRYLPETTDFNTTVNSLDVLTGRAIDEYGAGKVGVYAVSFSEVSEIMNRAEGKKNLSQVRWFGSDGNTRDPLLTGSTPAARFAEKVRFTGTIWGVPRENGEVNPVVATITERLGREPDGQAIALYDALWIATEVERDTGNRTNQSAISRAMVHHLNSSIGISQDLSVNPAGDRAMASYDILQVVPGPGGAGWSMVGQAILLPGQEKSGVVFTTG